MIYEWLWAKGVKDHLWDLGVSGLLVSCYGSEKNACFSRL